VYNCHRQLRKHSQGGLNRWTVLQRGGYSVWGESWKRCSKNFQSCSEYVKNKLANYGEWCEFIEMCFDANSPISINLKEMLFKLAEGKK